LAAASDELASDERLHLIDGGGGGALLGEALALASDANDDDVPAMVDAVCRALIGFC
jgi:hypothetical protein